MVRFKTGAHEYGVAVKRLLLRIWRYFERRWPFGKPALEYVETHLVDHCNMNCCGCSHFSCLAEPWFADPERFGCDLEALARLFRSVRTIRLMGGEPLLHPQVDRFLACTRKVFPGSRICLVTNGVLLEGMPETFWEACRENRIMLQLTVYPPMESCADACAALCREKGIRLVATHTGSFCRWLNRHGDSPLAESFTRYRKSLYCPVLKEGALYVCATSAYVGMLNQRFGLKLPCSKGIGLRTEGLTGRVVLQALNQPVQTCRYCAIEKDPAPWQNGAIKMNDWFVQGDAP